MANVCSTCLSQDRTLKRLESLKKDETLEWLHVDFLSPEQAMLCWECVSDLNRADRFRRRATKAQVILKSRVLGDGQIKSLSALVTSDTVKDGTYPKTDDILKQIRKNNVKINPKHRNICHVPEINLVKVDECDDTSNIEDTIKHMIDIINKDNTNAQKDYVRLFNIVEEVDANDAESETEPEFTEPITESDEDEPLAKIQKLTNTIIEPVKKNNNITVHNVLEPIIDVNESDFDANEYDVMDDPNYSIMEPIIDITEPGLNQNEHITVDDMNSNNNQKPGWPVLTLEGQSNTNVNKNLINRSKVHKSPKMLPIPIRILPQAVPPELLKLQMNKLKDGKYPASTYLPEAAPIVSKLRLMQAQKNMETNYLMNKQNLLKQKEEVLKRISLLQKSADKEPQKGIALKTDVLKQAKKSIPVFKIPKNTEMRKQAELLHRKSLNPSIFEEIRIYNPSKMNNVMADIVGAENSANDNISMTMKCEACLQQFANQKEFDKHKEQFHSERAGIYICSICTVRFKEEDVLKQHYMEHTDMDRAYECKICSFKHREMHVMEKHFTDTHQLKRCQFCSQQFKTQDELSDHVIKTHLTSKDLRKTKPPAFNCEHCNKGFPKPHLLYKHTMYSHPDKPLVLRCAPPADDTEGVCIQCDKTFPSINYHMLSQHPDWNEEAYCKQCKLQFTSKSRLSAHLKMTFAHGAPKKLMCEHCARSFVASKLAEHVATVHENKLLYSCDRCDQSFSRKHKLRAHVKSEHKKNTTRDHVCHECGAAFFTSGVLKSHTLIHLAEKPYHCAHCEWKFSTRGAFITHLRGKHPEYIVPRAPIK